MDTYKLRKIWNAYFPNDRIVAGDGYCIHHKDGDKKNNKKSNLQKMTHGEHTRHHQKGKPKPTISGNNNPAKRIEVRNKLRESRKKQIPPFQGLKHSKETKKKMSNWQKGVPKSEETKKKVSEGLKRYYANKNKTAQIKK